MRKYVFITLSVITMCASTSAVKRDQSLCPSRLSYTELETIKTQGTITIGSAELSAKLMDTFDEIVDKYRVTKPNAVRTRADIMNAGQEHCTYSVSGEKDKIVITAKELPKQQATQKKLELSEATKKATELPPAGIVSGD